MPINVTTITAFKTDDGVVFDTRKEADKYNLNRAVNIVANQAPVDLETATSLPTGFEQLRDAITYLAIKINGWDVDINAAYQPGEIVEVPVR